MYKFIEIPNIDQIKKEILKKFPNKFIKTGTLFYIDNHYEEFSSINLLKDALTELNLFDYVAGYSFYVTQPFTTGPIHIDHGDFNYSLNIPLIGCEDSQVCFYECTSDPILKDVLNEANIKIKYNSYEESTCEKIDSFAIKIDQYY